MPPVGPKPKNRNITDFFKSFAVPKSRVPANADIEDEIIVALPSSSPERQRQHASETPKPVRRIERSLSRSSTNSSMTERSASPTRESAERLPALDGTMEQELPACWSQSISQHNDPKDESSSSQPIKRPASIATVRIQMPPPAQSAMTSFSSISSLSSVPLSSQSSSKRMMKGGLYAVTNSDSGSEGSDSDDLEDMDTFIVRKKRKLTPPETRASGRDTPDTVRPTRQSTRVTGRASALRAESSRSHSPLPPTPPETVYKHSLMKMVKQNEKRDKIEAMIAEAGTKLEEAEKRMQGYATNETLVDGRTIVAAVADDSDDGERMLQAMERTEALQEEERFTFFTDGPPPTPNSKFPTTCLPNEAWAFAFKTSRERDQTCLTGFACDLAQRQLLPIAITSWFGYQLVHESREDLCEAYSETLMANTAHSHWEPANFSTLSSFYSTHAANSGSESHLSVPKGSTRRQSGRLIGSRDGLRHVVPVIVCCARACGKRAIGIALEELALANIDEQIECNSRLRCLVQDGIANLLDALQAFELEEVFQSFMRSIRESKLSKTLQSRLISSLPATTHRSHALRRYLALHQTTASDEMKAVSFEGWFEILISRLKSAPEFRIHESADYKLLLSLTTLLDLAIDAGLSSPPRSINKQSKTGPFHKSTALSPEEQAFNAQIDALATQLKLMASRIKDAGATHLRRTEAKSALERLVVRLETSVRTRPKAQVGLFGGGLGESKFFMEGWVGKMKAEEGVISTA